MKCACVVSPKIRGGGISSGITLHNSLGNKLEGSLLPAMKTFSGVLAVVYAAILSLARCDDPEVYMDAVRKL